MLILLAHSASNEKHSMRRMRYRATCSTSTQDGSRDGALPYRSKHGPESSAHSNCHQQLVGYTVREQVFDGYASCCLIRKRTGTGAKCQRYIEEVLIGAIWCNSSRERAPRTGTADTAVGVDGPSCSHSVQQCSRPSARDRRKRCRRIVGEGRSWFRRSGEGYRIPAFSEGAVQTSSRDIGCADVAAAYCACMGEIGHTGGVGPIA